MASPVVDETQRRDQTFADVTRGLATAQQQIEDTITAQRRFVLGDYGLLADVGRLVSSRVWTLDKQLALSAGRQGFTLAIYNAFLPTLWQWWRVTGCHTVPHFVTCDEPVPSQAVQVLGEGTSFEGLLPNQKPCDPPFVIPALLSCRFKSLEASGYGPTVKTLMDPITADCTYDAAADPVTSWHYGCSLGVTLDMLGARDSNGFAVWPFPFISCSAQYDAANPALFCPTHPFFGSRPPTHHQPTFAG